MLSIRTKPKNMLRTLDKMGKEEDLFSSLIDDFFHFHGYSTLNGVKNPNFSPSLDFIDNEDKYLIKIEIPGIDKKEISIEIDDKTLIVKGEKKYEHEETNNDVYVNEISYGTFRREIPLPNNCDVDKIKANYKDGLLYLDLPKTVLKEKEKRKIDIET